VWGEQVATDFVFGAEQSEQAQKELFERTTTWMKLNLTDHKEFLEWKNRQMRDILLSGLLPDHEPEFLEDFVFPKEIEIQLDLIQGYMELQSTLLSIKQCEFYFRRYPFATLGISRDAHISTCCELLFSRVYQFKEKWLAHLKRLSRRTKPTKIPTAFFEKQFRTVFDGILAARNEIHHERAYSDIQIKALGMGDLLALADSELNWTKVSQASYRQITNRWVKQVRSISKQIEVFAGFTAYLMLERCDFLQPDQ
jgi:hypothetical protein